MPRVAFDFTIDGGQVIAIAFRAEPDLIADVRRRRDDQAR